MTLTHLSYDTRVGLVELKCSWRHLVDPSGRLGTAACKKMFTLSMIPKGPSYLCTSPQCTLCQKK